ncbi:MAG: hypothetical protein ACRDRW_00475 [Pseudonocardiaceae bacterium]
MLLVEQVRGSCSTCGSRWVGAGRCHCPVCCVTWDDEQLYEAHRLGGGDCRSPQALGRLEPRLGVWCARMDMRAAG